MKPQNRKKYGSVSYDFKIATVILLFMLTLLRLALLSYFPSTEIISDKNFLFIVLFIVSYLWIQELIHYYRLVAINQELEESHGQLKEAEIDTIATLIKTEEAKDLYTKGHSERVTEISLTIAEEMHLDSESRRTIARAGILHDLGKIGISDTVLNKKDPLNSAEWRIIQAHPENAVKILSPLKFLATEREVILSHHERYDGKGYPRGLKGGDICLEALILAVADAFDAMNSKRSYRAPLVKDAVIKELIQGKGTQHSADAVDTLLSLLKKKPQLWER